MNRSLPGLCASCRCLRVTVLFAPATSHAALFICRPRLLRSIVSSIVSRILHLQMARCRGVAQSATCRAVAPQAALPGAALRHAALGPRMPASARKATAVLMHLPVHVAAPAADPKRTSILPFTSPVASGPSACTAACEVWRAASMSLECLCSPATHPLAKQARKAGQAGKCDQGSPHLQCRDKLALLSHPNHPPRSRCGCTTRHLGLEAHAERPAM